MGVDFVFASHGLMQVHSLVGIMAGLPLENPAILRSRLDRAFGLKEPPVTLLRYDESSDEKANSPN
jgi:hypothetical protein